MTQYLEDLIYFRRIMISLKTGHLTTEYIENNRPDSLAHLDISDPEIYKNIDTELNSLCCHIPTTDYIEDGYEEMYKICYCERCELSLNIDKHS
jgi:hypothetical protein